MRGLPRSAATSATPSPWCAALGVGRVAVGTDGTPNEESTARPPDRPTAWDHPVILTVAAKGEGIDELIAALDRHHEWLARSGSLEERRRRRMLERTREVVERAARRWIWRETQAEQLISERLDQVVDGTLSPYDVANEVLDGLKQGVRL